MTLTARGSLVPQLTPNFPLRSLGQEAVLSSRMAQGGVLSPAGRTMTPRASLGYYSHHSCSVHPWSHSTRGFSEMFLALEPDRVAGSTITAQALEQRKRPCSVTFPTPN